MFVRAVFDLLREALCKPAKPIWPEILAGHKKEHVYQPWVISDFSAVPSLWKTIKLYPATARTCLYDAKPALDTLPVQSTVQVALCEILLLPCLVFIVCWKLSRLRLYHKSATSCTISAMCSESLLGHENQLFAVLSRIQSVCLPQSS